MFTNELLSAIGQEVQAVRLREDTPVQEWTGCITIGPWGQWKVGERPITVDEVFRDEQGNIVIVEYV